MVEKLISSEVQEIGSLVDRATDLAQAVQDFQEDLGVSKQMGKLRERVDENAKELHNGRRWRRLGFALIAVSLFFGSVSAYLVIQLKSLVHTECTRSAKQAELRGNLIGDLTKHHVITSAESQALLTTGNEIPQVKC